MTTATVTGIASKELEGAAPDTFHVLWQRAPQSDERWGDALEAPYWLRFLLVPGAPAQLQVSPLPNTPATAYDRAPLLALVERAIREQAGWWRFLNLVADDPVARRHPKPEPALGILPPFMLAQHARHLTDRAPRAVLAEAGRAAAALPVARAHSCAPRRRVLAWLTVRETLAFATWGSTCGPWTLDDKEAFAATFIPLARTWCAVGGHPEAHAGLVALYVAALCGISNTGLEPLPDEDSLAARALAFDMAAAVVEERTPRVLVPDWPVF